jgi:hypothetical protein
MSYYEVMDATKMTEARTALICARFNLRDGKRRLQKGLTAAGVSALYDSMLFGMRYYITKHQRCTAFVENIEPWDALSLFHALTRAGVFDDPLIFNRFSLIVERTLWQGTFSFDAEAILAQVEEVLMTLGVIPFNEHLLLKKSRISH